MGILNWLFSKRHDGKFSEHERTLAGYERTIASLMKEVEVLRAQEEMNKHNREEINRLYREIVELKSAPSAKYRMAEMSYDELLEEAKRRRMLKESEPAKPVQSVPQRVGRSFRQGSVPSSTPSSQPSTYHDTMTPIVIASTLSSDTSRSDCSSPDSGSSSSPDSGSSSCDTGGGF